MWTETADVRQNNLEDMEREMIRCSREKIISELKRRGKRMTDQRKIMLDVILEGRWSSCKEIYYEASKRDPGIGKATVYRMIAVLEEIGVLNRCRQYSLRNEDELSSITSDAS